MKQTRMNGAAVTLLSGMMLIGTGIISGVNAAEKQPIPDSTKGGKPMKTTTGIWARPVRAAGSMARRGRRPKRGRSW